MTSAAAVFKKLGVQRAERLRPSGRCGPTPTTLWLNLKAGLDCKSRSKTAFGRHRKLRHHFHQILHPEIHLINHFPGVTAESDATTGAADAVTHAIYGCHHAIADALRELVNFHCSFTRLIGK